MFFKCSGSRYCKALYQFKGLCGPVHTSDAGESQFPQWGVATLGTSTVTYTEGNLGAT